MIELTPILIPTLNFAAVAIAVFVLGHYLSAQAKSQRRLPVRSTPDMPAEAALHGIDAFVVRHFTEGRFGIKVAARDKLRRKLLDAGYFSRWAVNYYLFARLACVVIIPVLVYILSELLVPRASGFMRLILVSVAILIKPFGISELIARARATLRPRIATSAKDPVIRSGPLEINLATRSGMIDGKRLVLGPKEYLVLQTLAQHPGKVVTRQQIMTQVWGSSHVADTHYLHIVVRKLRKKIEVDPTRPRILLTELGIGYRLVQ